MESIKIEHFRSEDLPELLDYNRKSFNHSNEKEFYNHRFVNNPAINSNTNYILVVKNGLRKIVGQTMFLPMQFLYKGAKEFGAWGTDMVIDKESRGTGIGIRLAIDCKKVDNLFVMGVTPASLNIFKKLNFHILDEFKRVIYIPSALSFLGLLFKGNNNETKLPETIDTNNHTFILQKTTPNIEKECWNNDVIEFVRDYSFLRWRYFDTYTHFSFYYNENNETPVYFVIKKMKWKGHLFIVLVDMRLNKNDKESFNSILKACKQVMSKTGAKGIISGSSLNEFSNIFSENGFFDFEKPTTILTPSKYGENYPYFKQEGIFLNMADSDFEYVYRLKGNLHRRIIKAYWQKIKGNKNKNV